MKRTVSWPWKRRKRLFWDLTVTQMTAAALPAQNCEPLRIFRTTPIPSARMITFLSVLVSVLSLRGSPALELIILRHQLIVLRLCKHKRHRNWSHPPVFTQIVKASRKPPFPCVVSIPSGCVIATVPALVSLLSFLFEADRHSNLNLSPCDI